MADFGKTKPVPCTNIFWGKTTVVLTIVINQSIFEFILGFLPTPLYAS